MREIELKFQVPPGRRSAVDAAVAGRGKAPRTRLQAAYYDTVDRALAAAGLALRVRREGRRWVQTLKGAGADGLTRAEHNVPLAPAHDPAAPADPALHAGTPVGDRLLELLAGHATPALACLYRTDIRRRRRELRTRLGVVELAFDEGSIVAGDRHLSVCELEIELLRGSPLAVMAAARPWVARHGLWLDTRSKAERGDLLSRGERQAPPRKAQDVHLDEETLSAGEALRCVLLSCLDQIAVNASQVASGDHDAEHVHQLRIGLRRVRTALRLFDATLAEPKRDAELADVAVTLFRGLGAARDRVAIAEPMERELSAALDAAGLRFEAPTLPLPPDAPEPVPLVRSAPAQAMLLTLFELTQAEPAAAADESPWREQVVRRLRRWHRKAATDSGRFATLDDAARHLLRKRVKRLRYGVEFAAGLFERKRVRRYMKSMRGLQERLGALVDLNLALDAYRQRSAEDAHALFAVGWLASRKEQLLRDSVDEVAAFAEVKPLRQKG